MISEKAKKIILGSGIAGFLVLNSVIYFISGASFFFPAFIIIEAVLCLPLLLIVGILHHPNLFNLPMRNAFSIVLLFSTWIPTIILSFQSFQISLPFRSYVNPNSLNSYTFWYIQKNDTNYTIKAGIERLLAKEHENFVINYLSNVPIDPDSNIHFNLVELKYHFGNPKKLKMSYFLGNKKGSLHTQILPNFLRLKDVVHRGLTL